MPNENDITLFAVTEYRGAKQRFGIRRKDRRRHIHMCGKSGTGKSTLLETLILSDIHAGEGVAVFDPHGDLIEHILSKIPSERAQDVIYLNPADTHQPCAVNILERSPTTLPYQISASVISIFKKLWKESWGPRMEHILRNAILTLLELPSATLPDISRLLVDRQFRGYIIALLQDTQIRQFWLKEFEQYSPNFRAEAIAPILNKVGQFLTNPIIRSIVEQPKSAFNMRTTMDSGKIVLINLAKGKIGEDACSLLGALVLTQIELAALSRADMPEHMRRDFYVYIDELHSIATDTFASVYSELRKYRVSITSANQYLQQLGLPLQSSLFGNVGTLISFRVSAEDASIFAKEFSPVFSETDLIALPMFNIILKLMIDGANSQPFHAMTSPS